MEDKNNMDIDCSLQLNPISEVEKKGQYYNDLFCLLARYSALEVSNIYTYVHIHLYFLYNEDTL